MLFRSIDDHCHSEVIGTGCREQDQQGETAIPNVKEMEQNKKKRRIRDHCYTEAVGTRRERHKGENVIMNNEEMEPKKKRRRIYTDTPILDGHIAYFKSFVPALPGQNKN